MVEEPLKQRGDNGRFLPGNTQGWKPGESGNAKGHNPNSVTALLKETDALTNQQIADVIIKRVLKGDYSFVREYLDRTDGKVTDTHKIEGDIPVSIVYKLKEKEDG